MSHDPRLERFLNGIKRARERRHDTVVSLADLVTALVDDLELIEAELSAGMERFRLPVRWRMNPPLPYWRRPGSDGAFGPTGIEWRAVNDRGRIVRTRRPAISLINACAEPHFAPLCAADLQNMARANLLYAQIRKIWRRIGMPMADVPASTDMPIDDRSTLRWQRPRRALAQVVSAGLRHNLSRVEQIDAELDEAMRALHNRLRPMPGSKRQVHLICRWELDGRTTERYTGPRGPAFFTRSARGSGPMLSRVPAGPSKSRSPISSRLLARMRYYVPSVRADAVRISEDIHQLRLQRDDIVSDFKRCGKALAYFQGNRYETVTGWD